MWVLAGFRMGFGWVSRGFWVGLRGFWLGFAWVLGEFGWVCVDLAGFWMGLQHAPMASGRAACSLLELDV